MTKKVIDWLSADVARCPVLAVSVPCDAPDVSPSV